MYYNITIIYYLILRKEENKMMNELKATIKKAIEQHYGELNDFGTYNRQTNEWLSTLRIYNIICDELDNYDWGIDE